jgi:hypothetical protein
MRTLRTTLATAALPCALLFALAGAASAQADITITSPAHSPEGFTNDRTPDVTFTGAVPFSSVTLEANDSGVIGTANADGTGSGTVRPDSDITAAPMDVDESGNPLGNRFGLTVRDPNTLDTVTEHIDQAPSMSGIGDGTYAAADVTFNASSAIPDHDVTLYIDGVADKTVLADSDGNFYDDIVPSASLLTAGPHTAYLTSTDEDGIQSSPSETLNFNVAPPAPRFSQLFDNVRLNQTQPSVSFADVDPAADNVTLYVLDADGNTVLLGQTTVINPDGTATIDITTPALSEGLNGLIATQTVRGVETVDYQGNNGPMSVFVDNSAPVLDTSFPGTLTNDNTPWFYASGTLQNNEGNHTFARLYLDGQLAGQSDPTTGGGSSGAQAGGPIADGTHTAYMVTVDDLGHESTVNSNTVAFTVDTVAPAAPHVTSPADGSTLASSPTTVTITTDPGADAHVLVDDVGEESDATADGNGTATFTLTQALAAGVHTLHVFSRDAAGNYSDVATTTFTVGTPPVPPAPTPPVTTPPTTTPPTAPSRDPDGDGIVNSWLIGGKAAPAPSTPKAKVSAGKVELKLTAAPKGAKKVRVYRADRKGGYKLVKTLPAKTKTFTDKKVKAGHTYKYKTVGVNAKGQQGKASKAATAKVKKN